MTETEYSCDRGAGLGSIGESDVPRSEVTNLFLCVRSRTIQKTGEMGTKVLLPTIASVGLILALQASVWYLWVDMAQRSIETPLNQLLLTRGLRANHVLNTTLQPVSFAQELLCKCAPLCCAPRRSNKCVLPSVAASVNNEVPDLSTQYLASGNVTSLIVTKPCDLISYIAGLQQVTKPTRYPAAPTLLRCARSSQYQ